MLANTTMEKSLLSEASLQDTIRAAFKELYPNVGSDSLDLFLREIRSFSEQNQLSIPKPDWYKDAVVYSLYVDLYAGTFENLSTKLDYLQDLGVNVIWLLPILDSPMRDAGFDIRNYKMVRPSLTELPAGASDEAVLEVFRNFLNEAHQRGIRVIFDIAMNHTSNEHPWFKEAASSEDNPKRDYYIWSDDTTKYGAARLLFKGMCNSNWEPFGDTNYFHRFFEFQPDLNYRNPELLFEMTRTLLFWISQGVDGFRADAIPYIWKEEHTDCENLPETHTIVRFMRAVLDFVRPGTLLLAEACQKPTEVVKYMGKGDECHAAYHFPLMPQIYKALAQESTQPIRYTLSPEVTPVIPVDSQWFTFLRCHDELSLELVYVSEEDRAYIHENYCHQNQWDFRVGEGISARLSELMKFDARKVALSYSIMLSLPGTPVLYYGDEFGKANDDSYYHEQIKLTGKDDTRFLVRGKVDWQETEAKLNDASSFEAQVFAQVRAMLRTRTKHPHFGRGRLNWKSAYGTDKHVNKQVLCYTREYNIQ